MWPLPVVCLISLHHSNASIFWERTATCFSAGGMAGSTFVTAGRDGRHFRYLS